MAEFDSEAANLNLFHEIFNLRSLQNESADVSSCIKDVNSVGDRDLNIKKHSQTGSFLKSPVQHSELDNGVLTHTHVTGDLEEGSHANCVRLNNIENLKKTDSTNGSVIKTTDDKDDTDGDDRNTVYANGVNGVANAVHESAAKACEKKKKRVSFPKDVLISSYVDPPDPWKNAPSWTTEDLVSAYKKSCEINGTKPITKLIQQLQAMSLSDKREELLSLKGEKLDQKQCECIEEILRRVQFKLLDLEASHLDDECAVAIFDMIEHYESACQLNIAFNKNIQARGWQACSRLVRRAPDLTYLDLRSCELSDRTIPILGRALKLGCHLTILHMENINLSGRPLIILVAALKVNETLRELFLAENKLMPTDGVQLGNLLCYNHKLSLIDLRNNYLQDVGTSHICEGLTEQTKGCGLRTLVLWNNSISYQAMSVLGRALVASQNMETLNIGHNSITNEGAHLLKDGLLRVTSLLRLGLQGTKISDEGAVALAEYIAESTALLRIDLRDNDIKTAGLMALSHAMRVNTSVTRIDLDKEPKKEPGVKDYIEQQSRLLRDILTFQQRNLEAALKREEQERARLKAMAQAEVSAIKKEAESKQQAGTLPANSSTESFTLIEEEIDQNDEQDKSDNNAENVMAKITNDKTTKKQVSSERSSGDDELDSSLHKEDGKPQQRPSVLFTLHGLSPQASLDSPVPTSNVSHAVSGTSSPISESASQPGPSSRKAFPALAMSSTPAEMILSPQYFPKQIARKIFSVIRVNEDTSSCNQRSASTLPHPLSAAFDPVAVSSMLLVPVSSSLSLLPSSSMPVLQCDEGVPQHSKMSLQDVSPSASLFQDLAEETVKSMVSPDAVVNGVLVKNAEPNSSQKDIGSTQDSDNVNKDFTGVSSSILKSSRTGVEFSKRLSVSHNDTDICDNLKPLVTQAAGSKISASASGDSSDNSVREKIVVKDYSVTEERGAFASEDEALQQKSFHSKSVYEKARHLSKTSFASLGFELKQDCSHDGQEGNLRMGNMVEAEGHYSALKEVTEANVSKNGTEAENNEQLAEMSCDSTFFSVKESCENHTNLSDSQSNIATFLNVENHDDDEAMAPRGSCEEGELFHQYHHEPDICSENSQSVFHIKEKHSSSMLTDLNPQEELVTVCLNNFSSPSLLVEEFVSPSLQDTSVTNKRASGESSEHLFSPTVDLLRLKTGGVNERRDKHTDAVMPSLEDEIEKLTNDSSDKLDTVNNLVGDNIDIENVDFSLDEEPWLTVGVDIDGSDPETSKRSLKQPDFFTTLTMNGLTQELASALTPLDGPSSPFEVEDYDLGTQSHDEFEKELDAMLAIVQSELPWPLKGS